MNLYAAIASDTGNFAYSSTTARTFSVMADVMQSGFDLAGTNRSLFRNISLRKTRLQADALCRAEILADGRGALAAVSEKDMAAFGASKEDGDTIVDALRDIDTVEAAVYLREEKEHVKASLRAKGNGNVGALAKKYGGGGHMQAAGCTLQMPLAEATELMRRELLALLSK